MITPETLRRDLLAQCERAGGIRAWAARKGIPNSLVSMTLSGKREPAETICNALGVVRRTVFERVKK